ncbi:transcriptional repressor [Sphingobacterium sp. LRF_L2]|uniref:transcriptional repressor n=1 Tax=Sphingobacterium sp. LRF_L2 TaxID=3369421 RepID=UPI003F622166
MYLSYDQLLCRVEGYLKTIGHKPTKQRVLVLHAVYHLKEITEAEDIWIHINKEAKISLASVYNNLNVLVRNGIVSRVRLVQRSGYVLSDNLFDSL